MPASAQTIYRCTDAAGGMLISNAKVDKSCKPVVISPDSTLPAPKNRAPSAAANPSPAGFPKVPEEAQKARDTDRKRILEQELAGEQRSLEPVSYTHLDVYKRQGLRSQTRQLQ